MLHIVGVLLSSLVDSLHLLGLLSSLLPSLKRMDIHGRTVRKHLPDPRNGNVADDDPEVSGQDPGTLDRWSIELDFLLKLAGLLALQDGCGVALLAGEALFTRRRFRGGSAIGAVGSLGGMCGVGHRLKSIGHRDIFSLLPDTVIRHGLVKVSIFRSGTLPEKGAEEEVVPSKSYSEGDERLEDGLGDIFNSL